MPWLVAGAAALAGPHTLGAEVHEGWVPVAAVTSEMTVDHGRRVGPTGRRWVRVRAPAGAFGEWSHQPLPPPAVGYPGVEEGLERLEQAVAGAPRAGSVALGASEEGRGMVAAWFGQAPWSGAPAVRVVAGHHGDEAIGWMVALELAEELSAADGVDPAWSEVLDDTTVWVVPMANPDGVEANTRHNAAGIDLNRSYDWAWQLGSVSGEVPLEPAETWSLASWGQLVRPALGVSLHSGANNLGWVWNHDLEPAPDAQALRELALDYAQTLGDDTFWVTNGAEWYRTYGDQNDWSYGRYGGWDFTLELSEVKAPPVDTVGPVVERHLQALQQLLATPIDVFRVVDATTGEPVEAWVETSGRGRWTDPVLGQVGLPEGQEVVRAEAFGYDPAPFGADGVARVVPRRLVRSPPRLVAVGDPLPGDWPDPFTLHQAGRASLDGLRAGDRAEVPGLFTVEGPGGQVWPHGLIVTEGWATDDDRAVAGATGIRGGRPAWGLVADGEADVWWSAGRWLRGAPSGDVVAEGVRPRGAACQVVPVSGHLLLAWLSLGWVARRQL